MKKKAIIILLFLPFIIALFAFITTTYLIRDVEQDITDIQFDYEANQYFDLSDGRVELKAEAVYNEKYPVSAGNDLVWSITGESDVASISSSGSTYYLNLLKQGQCQVTCSNEKGNVSKSFMANIIGSAGGVIINATPNFTMQGIDQERYVGLYDLSYSDLVKDQYQKVNSELQLSIEVYPEEVSLDDLVVETSSNVKFNAVDQTVKLLSSGESYVKFYGETLAAWWRKVEYFGGKIWFCGEETDAHILQFELDGYVFSVCGDYTRVSLHKVGK